MNPIAIKDRRHLDRNRMPTRRRYHRVQAPCAVFYESSHRALHGEVEDLSPHGAFVPTAQPDPAGCRALVRLCLPGSITMLKLSCRVVRSNSDPDAGPVGMALRFDVTQQWQLKRIAAVMLEQAGWQAFPGLQERIRQRGLANR